MNEEKIKRLEKKVDLLFRMHLEEDFYFKDNLHEFIPLFDLSIEMNFSLKELWIVAEVILGQSLHTMTEDQSIELCAVLEDIKEKCAHTGRKKVWNEWLDKNNLSPVRGYNLTGLNFPSILNSKKAIKAKIKKGNVALKKEAVG